MRARVPVRGRIVVTASGRNGKRRGGHVSLGKPLAFLFGTALGMCAVAGVARAQDVVGTWLTEGGTSQVRVTPCGGARCGTIIWTKAAVKDVNNPDPARRDASLIGMRMIRDARRSGEGWTGSLYNPLDGRTYTGRMRLISPSQLELSGCVLAGLICNSQTWTRLK